MVRFTERKTFLLTQASQLSRLRVVTLAVADAEASAVATAGTVAEAVTVNKPERINIKGRLSDWLDLPFFV